MYNYGIVSTASIVERFVEGIKESADGNAYAICSRTLKSAKDLAAKLNIPHYYDNSEALYNNPNIDIIYIPTINELHYPEAKKALQAKKHVIVEKPFTLTSTQARELFDIARKNQCFLMEAQKSVFLPTTIKVKELLQNDIIGDVKYIELKAGFPGRFSLDHWMYDVRRGGGALYGSATYTVELLQFLYNNPNIIADGSCKVGEANADMSCNFQLLLNNDILVSSTISMETPLQNEAVFYGDKGYIVIPNYWKSREVKVYLHDGTYTYYPFEFGSEFTFEIEHIHECISKNIIESPIMNSKRTIDCTTYVEQLYKKWQLL